MRKVIALSATPGLVVVIYIFIASFFGMTMDKLGVGRLSYISVSSSSQFHWSSLSVSGQV